MEHRLWLVVVSLLSLVALAQPAVVGRGSVVDGDTLEIQGQRYPCGRRAAFALADFLNQRTVACQARDTDRYGRMVAVCSVGGVEINRWLVEQGWALDFSRYSGGHYQAAQEAARQERRGIWQGRFEPPWEYRRR